MAQSPPQWCVVLIKVQADKREFRQLLGSLSVKNPDPQFLCRTESLLTGKKSATAKTYCWKILPGSRAKNVVQHSLFSKPTKVGLGLKCWIMDGRTVAVAKRKTALLLAIHTRTFGEELKDHQKKFCTTRDATGDRNMILDASKNIIHLHVCVASWKI